MENDETTPVHVQFWGVRGSIPTPGPETVRYGGNTSCVTVEGGDGKVYIFDAGSGIRPLGIALVGAGRLPVEAYVFITHTHWDHIQGLPFFVPSFIPGNTVHLHGSPGDSWNLEEAISGQMAQQYFPVSMDMLAAELSFTHVEPGEFTAGNATVRTAALNHGGSAIGYRLELSGCSVAYVTDDEPLGGPNDLTPNPESLTLARGADLLIHDCQFTIKEYREGKEGWGHSPLDYVVRFAVEARVRRLVLFHHDPMHNDMFIDRMVAEARMMAAKQGAGLTISAASEGTGLDLLAG